MTTGHRPPPRARALRPPGGPARRHPRRPAPGLTVLLGRNGSGRTTTLRALAGTVAALRRRGGVGRHRRDPRARVTSAPAAACAWSRTARRCSAPSPSRENLELAGPAHHDLGPGRVSRSCAPCSPAAPAPSPAASNACSRSPAPCWHARVWSSSTNPTQGMSPAVAARTYELLAALERVRGRGRATAAARTARPDGDRVRTAARGGRVQRRGRRSWRDGARLTAPDDLAHAGSSQMSRLLPGHDQVGIGADDGLVGGVDLLPGGPVPGGDLAERVARADGVVATGRRRGWSWLCERARRLRRLGRRGLGLRTHGRAGVRCRTLRRVPSRSARRPTPGRAGPWWPRRSAAPWWPGRRWARRPYRRRRARCRRRTGVLRSSRFRC